MPRRLLKVVARQWARDKKPAAPSHAFSVEDVVWAMGSFCALNRKPFDGNLLVRQFPPPYTSDSLIHAARALGFRIRRKDCDAATATALNLPCLVLLREAAAGESPQGEPGCRPAIVVQANAGQVLLFEAGTNTPHSLPAAEFAGRYAGTAFQLALESAPVKNPDGSLSGKPVFGFHWFIPELLKH